jgi:hypothetical protein
MRGRIAADRPPVSETFVFKRVVATPARDPKPEVEALSKAISLSTSQPWTGPLSIETLADGSQRRDGNTT